MAMISLVASIAAWAGANAAGAQIGFGAMLRAAANCWAMGCLFLGLATAGYVLAPRSAVAVAYGLVMLTFLWQLFGAVLARRRG